MRGKPGSCQAVARPSGGRGGGVRDTLLPLAGHATRFFSFATTTQHDNVIVLY